MKFNKGNKNNIRSVCVKIKTLLREIFSETFLLLTKIRELHFLKLKFIILQLQNNLKIQFTERKISFTKIILETFC